MGKLTEMLLGGIGAPSAASHPFGLAAGSHPSKDLLMGLQPELSKLLTPKPPAAPGLNIGNPVKLEQPVSLNQPVKLPGGH